MKQDGRALTIICVSWVGSVTHGGETFQRQSPTRLECAWAFPLMTGIQSTCTAENVALNFVFGVTGETNSCMFGIRLHEKYVR